MLEKRSNCWELRVYGELLLYPLICLCTCLLRPWFVGLRCVWCTVGAHSKLVDELLVVPCYRGSCFLSQWSILLVLMFTLQLLVHGRLLDRLEFGTSCCSRSHHRARKQPMVVSSHQSGRELEAGRHGLTSQSVAR